MYLVTVHNLVTNQDITLLYKNATAPQVLRDIEQNTNLILTGIEYI